MAVLFCDLVGSTALSGRLDPEDLRQVVLAYQAVSVEAIEQRGGRVVQYQGDGISCTFGHGRAGASETRQAVDAGLAILAAVKQLRDHPPVPGVQVEVRVGVHVGPATGLSVGAAADGGAGAGPALGPTPAMAAAVQGLAPPGGLAITEPVRRALAESHGFRSLGTRHFEAFGVSVECHVLEARPG